MEEKKVALKDEELDKDYLVTDPKKNRFSTKFIDISITCFGIVSCALLAYILITLGNSLNDGDRILRGCVYAGVSVLLLVWLIIVIRCKNLKFIGGVYPVILTVFSVTTSIVTTVQRLIAGESLVKTGNLWNMPIVFICMSVLAIISLILYCQKSKNYSPRFMMAAFALSIMPTLAMMKNQSSQLLWYFGEYMVTPQMLLTTDGIIGIGGTLMLLLAIVAMMLGFGVRLIDRGDNYLKVEPRIVEVPVEVVDDYSKPRRGLLIFKAKKRRIRRK